MENSGSSTSSSGSAGNSGNYGTLGRGGGGGMASMMDEMAKTLARRRAAVEKKQPEQPQVGFFLDCNILSAFKFIAINLQLATRLFFFLFIFFLFRRNLKVHLIRNHGIRTVCRIINSRTVRNHRNLSARGLVLLLRIRS